MAWTNSRIFRAYLADCLGNVAALDADADLHHAALYNNTITPDQDAASASTAYNTGQWATAQEVFEAVQWPAAGVALTSVVLDRATAGVVFFDAADTASGTAADLTNATGVLVYDNTISTPVADQGVCYNYLGGPNSVVNGTFTVIWPATGIYRFTL